MENRRKGREYCMVNFEGFSEAILEGAEASNIPESGHAGSAELRSAAVSKTSRSNVTLRRRPGISGEVVLPRCCGCPLKRDQPRSAEFRHYRHPAALDRTCCYS